MEQMKRVFSRMLEDPQAPPLRDSAEVIVAARRSMRRAAMLRTTVAALAAVAVLGSWTLLRNDFSPQPPPYALPTPSLAASASPVQLTAADVAGRLDPKPTPIDRIVWIIEGKSSAGGVIYWYIDTISPVPNPCVLPYDVPQSPVDTCGRLQTPTGVVWVRRQHARAFAADSNVVSIYIPLTMDKALLYTASNLELPGNDGTWSGRGLGSAFQITDDEIASIVVAAHDLDERRR